MEVGPVTRAHKAEAQVSVLANAVLSLAEDAGVPDSFYATDWRLVAAQNALNSDEPR